MKTYVFESKWTAYRIIKNDKKSYRLLKMHGNVDGIKSISLLSPSGIILDNEIIPVYISGLWHFGFWIDEDHIDERVFKLK